MQKYRGFTRWIPNAFERHFIRTYSCCIQIVLVEVCLCDSTPGNFNIQLRAPVNPWHTLSNSSDTVALKTNLIKQMLWSQEICFNNNMQHDLRRIYTNIFSACLNMRDNNCNLFFPREWNNTIRILETESSVRADWLSLCLSLGKCKWWKSRLRRKVLASRTPGKRQHQRQPTPQMRQDTARQNMKIIVCSVVWEVQMDASDPISAMSEYDLMMLISLSI